MVDLNKLGGFMVKIMIALGVFGSSLVFAKEKCSEASRVELKPVTHVVDTATPSHLKGAKITVRLADGRESTVPAEKFMVVPRKQVTVAGQDKVTTVERSCRPEERKNLLIGEVRHDTVDLDASTKKIPGGVSARVDSKKGLVPGVSYFRRNLFDSRIGAGVGVDANGVPKGMLGVEF